LPGYWAVTALQAALHGNGSRTLLACAVLTGFAGAAALVAMSRVSRGGGRSARL